MSYGILHQYDVSWKAANAFGQTGEMHLPLNGAGKEGVLWQGYSGDTGDTGALALYYVIKGGHKCQLAGLDDQVSGILCNQSTGWVSEEMWMWDVGCLDSVDCQKERLIL